MERSHATAGRRRVSVVLDGPPAPRWQARALEALAASAAIEITAVRFAGGPRRGAVRRAHEALERHLFTPGPAALAPSTLDRGELTAGSAPASGEELLVWLAAPAPPPGERGAILYLRHGGVLESAEDAFRRAVLRGRPWLETEVLLRRAGETTLLARTVSGARPFSSTMSRDKALWKIAALVGRAAERPPGLGLAAPGDIRPPRAPSTAELIVRAPIAWLRVLGARLLFRRPWQIRVRELGADPTAGWPAASALVRHRRGHLYADPFLLQHRGRHHLFCEELPPGANRARIAHTELRLDGAPSGPPEPVLAAPYHLSYPCVFAHGGELFMIPETSSERRLELWRADDFPRSWVRERILFEGLIASDATLLAHAGRLWLFVCVAVPHATMLDELHLFSGTDPRGPWTPHPLNPIVSDVRCARPAGAIQRWGARLVRPAQDNSRRYGGAISFREIDALDEQHYVEHELARLEPSDLGDARATHTYACDGRFEAIDLRRREARLEDPALLAREIAQVLARLRARHRRPAPPPPPA